ncbi:MAG: serine/threonine-protein kinase [Kofleriaceae bacterium]
MGPTPDDSGVVPIGAMLDGRYRVDGVLGKGGMGRVYKGEHMGIGRAVAIKVLHPDLGKNKEASQRFQREAMASGRLDHPNIVSVSDSGVMADGCPYLVMEVLEGEELGKRLEREKRIPWLEAIDIMRGVLMGLRHAHEKHVVHRDIKPDNIFLAKKDGETVVKILDFGIAKLVAGDPNDPASTRTGLTVGTPAYLSPEQAVGGEIKPATDLYSASVVFYEMLAGRPPFEDTDPLAIMTAHVSREPPTFAEVAPDLQLPQNLETVIRHGLEKISAERIQTANDYLALLDDVLRNAGYAPARMSGQISQPVAIPTPPPGSIIVNHPAATPGVPFPAAAMTAPTAAFTPIPTPSPEQPLDQKKWLIIAGIVVGVIFIIAIALKVSGKKAGPDEKAPPPKTEPDKPAPPPPKDKKRAEADPPPDPPKPSPVVEAAREMTAATVPHDTQLKAALHDLTTGKTCTDRKAAVAVLKDLGDPKAIGPLKQARYRMRGGVLGIGDSNSNACLKADADEAIKALSAAK